MSLEVYIAKDKHEMSFIGYEIVSEDMSDKGDNYNLGLATGATPLVLYSLFADNKDMIEKRHVNTWNLDEYVISSIGNAEERKMHPESYFRFMHDNLFSKVRFNESFIPPGYDIDSKIFEKELLRIPDSSWLGKNNGLALHIDGNRGYLGKIRDEMINPYIDSIIASGGIDLWVTGVGGNGHRAFHESGIPLETEPMFVVKLDDVTLMNAVRDGHFESIDDCFRYALSMSAKGVVDLSRKVLVLASGERKKEPIKNALLGHVTEDVPISIDQKYIDDSSKDIIYVVDEKAGEDLIRNKRLLQKKGIYYYDTRGA